MANYASLSEVKDYLDISVSDSDTILSTFIASASQKIDEYIGYTFEVEYGVDETQYNVQDMDIIVLKKYPIVGISSIESGVDYKRKNDVGILVLDNRFTGDFNLSVSYGQTPPDVVKTTCMELVNLFWSRRKTIGLKSMSIGDFSMTTSSSFGADMKDILDTIYEYRDTNFARKSPLYNQMI
jgi:hypothetical protein